MPIFQYKGYKTDGSQAAGTIEANSAKDAALRLRESGLYPKNVRELSIKDGSPYSKDLTFHSFRR